MEEILIVFTVLVLTPLSVFYGIRMLRESKHRMQESEREASGGTMRRSELESLILDAVIEATAPLEARIDELEREQIRAGRIDGGVLAEAFDGEEQTASGARRRERA